jgi:NADP-reducing hydrogenase subunit HndB
MKSLNDFNKYVNSLDKANKIQILIGYATCGISAGADKVFDKIITLVEKDDYIIKKTGCLGICRLEPIVEIIELDGTRTTYVEVDVQKIVKIVDSHLKNGKVVEEFTIGSND